MIYISLVFVLLGIAFAIFYQCQTRSVHLRRACEQMATALRFGERWRKETAAAASRPTLEQDSAWIKFTIPQKNGEVIYLFQNGFIFRKPADAELMQPFVEGVRKFNVVQERRGGIEGWRLELELFTYEKNPKIKPLLSFLSVGPA
jgi:hypothetical protein